MTKTSAVLGLQTDELTGVYLALEQMLSKGKITTEELRRQLGERLPGAMGIMAAAMGVTIPELDKMMKKGEVLSAEVLPDFAIAMEAAFGVENIDNVNTMAASIGRLEGSWQSFVEQVSRDGSAVQVIFGGILDAMTEVIDLYAKTLRSPLDRMNDYVQEAETKFEKNINGMFKTQEEIAKEVEEMGYDSESDRINKLVKLRKEENEKLKEWAKEQIETYESLVDARLKIWNQENEKYANASSAATDLSGWFEKVYLGTETDRQTANAVGALNVLRKLLEEDDPIAPLEEGGDGDRVRRIKMAREYLATFREQIEANKIQIRQNAFLLKQDGLSLEAREKLVDKQKELRLENNKLIQADRKTKALDAYNAEVARWEKALTGFKEGSERYEEQYEQYEIGMQAAKDKYNEQLGLIDRQFENDNLKDEQTYYDESMEAFENFLKDRLRAIKESVALENQAVNEKLARIGGSFSSGSAAEKAAKDSVALAEIKAFNAEIDAQIVTLRKKIGFQPATEGQRESWQQQINYLESLRKGWAEYYEGIYTGDGAWEAWTALAVNALSEYGAFIDELFNRRIAQIDAEISATERLYDRKIELARDDVKQQEALEQQKADLIEKLERKKVKEQQLQAKFQKALALTNAIQNTAVGIANATTAQPPWLAIALAGIFASIGAAQVATILAQPIPQYATGGHIKEDHVGMINDGGRKEYIERDGRILSTDSVNAVVPLKSGDTIYPSLEDLRAKSLLVSGLLGGEALNDEEIDTLMITDAIAEGFKRAKINNHIKLGDNSAYAEQLSRWN